MLWTRREQHCGGLSGRDAQVLNLAAKGLTTQQIAERPFISPKTADHHIQRIYTKIGVSTRAAAALWAMQKRRRALSATLTAAEQPQAARSIRPCSNPARG